MISYSKKPWQEAFFPGTAPKAFSVLITLQMVFIAEQIRSFWGSLKLPNVKKSETLRCFRIRVFLTMLYVSLSLFWHLILIEGPSLLVKWWRASWILVSFHHWDISPQHLTEFESRRIQTSDNLMTTLSRLIKTLKGEYVVKISSSNTN